VKKILLGLVLGIFTTIGGYVSASYYAPYGTVNGVLYTTNVIVQQQENAKKNVEVKKEEVKKVEKRVETKEDKELTYRIFNTGNTRIDIEKFVDPDNGNVCYMIITNANGGISCVKK